MCVQFLLNRPTRDMVYTFHLSLSQLLIFIEIYNKKLIENFIFQLRSIRLAGI